MAFKINIDQPSTDIGTADKQGNVTASRSFLRYMTDLRRRMGADDDFVDTARTDVVTSQTSANNSGAYWIVSPEAQGWNTDGAGAHEAGNPSQTILFTLKDNKDVTIATASLIGTLTTASGNITVAATGVDTGLTTTKVFDPTSNADPTVVARVTATFADGSKVTGSRSWSAVDVSVAGGTPSSGGGK